MARSTLEQHLIMYKKVILRLTNAQFYSSNSQRHKHININVDLIGWNSLRMAVDTLNEQNNQVWVHNEPNV